MNDNNAWNNFEQTGKVSDYLAYKGIQKNEIVMTSEADTNADKNSRNRFETAKYR